jgi:hypothetical protein
MSDVASPPLAVEQSQRLIVLGPALLFNAQKLLAWSQRQPIELFMLADDAGQPGPELLEILTDTAALVEAIVGGHNPETEP